MPTLFKPVPRRSALRAIEFLILFLAAPFAISQFNPGPWIFLALWLGAAICLALLLQDPSFDRHQLWNLSSARREILRILLLFLCAAALTILVVWWWFPDRLFSFPRQRPRLWAMVMLLYPILSVYPQNLIYRAFFIHRYQPLFAAAFPPRIALVALILASAAAFSLAHLSFRNNFALTATFLGGLLFTSTFLRTRSLAATSLEHALYGCAIFTIGLGSFLYHGSATGTPAQQQTSPSAASSPP